jgi:hypothetical protein
MSKSVKAVVIVLVIFVLGWVGYGSYLALSSNKNNSQSETKSDDSTAEEDMKTTEYALKNDGLKFNYSNKVSIVSSTETNTDEAADVPRGDDIELESGNLKLSIISAVYGVGGQDNCSIEGTVCEVVTARDVKLFDETMKMTLWKETSKQEESGSDATVQRVFIGSTSAKEDRGLFTYTFKSINLKDTTGESAINVLSLSSKNSDSITEQDFNSSDMNNLVDVISSMHY